MNKILLSLLLVLTDGSINAQDKFAIYLDLGGASPIASFNMEKRFNKLSSLGLGYKFGVGLVLTDGPQNPYPTVKLTPSFPIGLNYLFGKKNKVVNLEIAFQTTFVPNMGVPEPWDRYNVYRDPIRNEFFSSAFLGYRIKPFHKKGIIRVGYNPVRFRGSWQT